MLLSCPARRTAVMFVDILSPAASYTGRSTKQSSRASTPLKIAHISSATLTGLDDRSECRNSRNPIRSISSPNDHLYHSGLELHPLRLWHSVRHAFAHDEIHRRPSVYGEVREREYPSRKQSPLYHLQRVKANRSSYLAGSTLLRR